MAAGTAASLCCLMFVGVFAFVSADQKNIIAESGQDVILPCRAPNKIVAIEWSKDLWNLLYYQIGQFDQDNQNPAYKNRVDLRDRQMKDGDVSLILKDVTVNDTGTYRCYVAWGEPNQEAWLNLTCTINLSVVPPGQTGGDTEDGGKEDGSVGLIAGLSVAAVILVAAVVGFLAYRKHKVQKQSQYPHQPPDELQHGNGSANHTESEKPALLKQTEG